MSTQPLSSGDLRALADVLDVWNETLIDGESGNYRPFADFANAIVIQLNDGLSIPVGHLVFEGGWVGLEFGA